MAFIFFLGVVIAVAAPLLRRRDGAAAAALAGGAGIVIALSLFIVIHPDLRSGEAAVEANWRLAMMILGCEMPVLILALISLAHRRKAFWVGWAIHFLFTFCVIAVVVELTFFWHW